MSIFNFWRKDYGWGNMWNYKKLNAYKINNLIVKVNWIFVSNYFDEDRKRSAIKVLKKNSPALG